MPTTRFEIATPSTVTPSRHQRGPTRGRHRLRPASTAPGARSGAPAQHTTRAGLLSPSAAGADTRKTNGIRALAARIPPRASWEKAERHRRLHPCWGARLVPPAALAQAVRRLPGPRWGSEKSR
jgi:hypothetical protein